MCCIAQGGGGDTLIFAYTHRHGSFFGVQNFEFQYFLGFQKNEYFWGMKILGSSQNWIIFRGHFYAFWGIFLRSRYRMRDIFFWGGGGVLKIQIFFWGA